MSTAARDYAPLRAPLPRARHLPGHFYTSPEIYALEKEKIFRKEWLCVGRMEEIERPGDYLTFRVADEPLLVCRDENGQLNAFYNVCRHRGTEVACGRGNAVRVYRFDSGRGTSKTNLRRTLPVRRRGG